LTLLTPAPGSQALEITLHLVPSEFGYQVLESGLSDLNKIIASSGKINKVDNSCMEQ
jgi:hypothetical protein